VNDAAVAVNVLKSDGSELPGPVKQIITGVEGTTGTHSCAIDATSQMWCWGNNYYGQLGNGTRTNSNYAQLVKKDATTTLTDVTDIALGLEHTCAIASSLVYCWGSSWFGETGQPPTGGATIAFNTYPTVVKDSLGAPLTGFSKIGAGQRTTCGIKSGSVWCWGINREGELGSNLGGIQSTAPVLVKKSDNTALTGVNKLSVGMFHICASITDGTMWCWGANDQGELGNGLIETGRFTAVQVLKSAGVPLTGVLDISLGDIHTCASLSTGMWCWGYNNYGQLGDGTKTQRSYPVQVQLSSGAVLTNVTVISAGAEYTCAVANAKALCWGINGVGQLGDGTFIDKLKAIINGL
jgi:alpha-tubulin suppressor-like RCC1 family protein